MDLRFYTQDRHPLLDRHLQHTQSNFLGQVESSEPEICFQLINYSIVLFTNKIIHGIKMHFFLISPVQNSVAVGALTSWRCTGEVSFAALCCLSSDVKLQLNHTAETQGSEYPKIKSENLKYSIKDGVISFPDF